MQVSLDILAGAPLDITFGAAADLADWPRFIAAIERVEILTSGPVAVGTRFRETRVMFGRQATEEMTVAELSPPKRMVFTATNHGTAYRVQHDFAAEGAGTRVSLTFEGRPVTLMARLLLPLGLMFMGSVRRQLQSDLADLAREAERRHRTGQG